MRKTRLFLATLLAASLLMGCTALPQGGTRELAPIAQKPPEEEVRLVIPTPSPRTRIVRHIPREAAEEELTREPAEEEVEVEEETEKHLPPVLPAPEEEGQASGGEGKERSEERTASVPASALEPWQEEIVQDYLEAWTYFFQEVRPDPARVPYYFQDVSWQGEEMPHENHIVQGMEKYLTSLDDWGWKGVHEVPEREVRTGSPHPSDAHLIEVVDYVPQGTVIHKIDLTSGETIEDTILIPHANLAIMVYDDQAGRWKIGGLEHIDLPADPEEAAEKHRMLLEEAKSWR